VIYAVTQADATAIEDELERGIAALRQFIGAGGTDADGTTTRLSERCAVRSPMRTASRFLLVAAFLAVAPSAASAEVRSAAIDDARDAPESLNGPRALDIERVAVNYDTSLGRVAVTVRLFERWEDTQGQYPYVELRLVERKSARWDSCSASGSKGILINGSLAPYGENSTTATHSDYDDTASGTRTMSADGRDTTFIVEHPAFANRDAVCVSHVMTYFPDPYGHCSPSDNNCQRISYRYYGDATGIFFFAGHELYEPPKPACSDGLDNEGDGNIDLSDPDCSYDYKGTSEGAPPTACDNKRDDDGDGKLDLNDPGCQGKRTNTTETDPTPVKAKFRFDRVKATRSCAVDIEVEVLPDLVPERLFKFGKVEITVSGIRGKARGYRKTRTLPLGTHPNYLFKRLKPGRYKVTGRYLGDQWRLKTKRTVRKVKVCVR
jgi:hypothetical protein